MLITKNAAHKKENGNTCTVWEYDFKKQEVGFSCAQINGRYPATGRVVNMACDLIYFVVSGSCVIHIENQVIELKQHDAFFLERNKEYFVVGDQAMLTLVESPRWTFGQVRQLT